MDSGRLFKTLLQKGLIRIRQKKSLRGWVQADYAHSLSCSSWLLCVNLMSVVFFVELVRLWTWIFTDSTILMYSPSRDAICLPCFWSSCWFLIIFWTYISKLNPMCMDHYLELFVHWVFFCLFWASNSGPWCYPRWVWVVIQDSTFARSIALPWRLGSLVWMWRWLLSEF